MLDSLAEAALGGLLSFLFRWTRKLLFGLGWLIVKFLTLGHYPVSPSACNRHLVEIIPLALAGIVITLAFS